MAPIATKSGAVPPKAFQLALDGSAKLVLQFGGQGVAYWEELKQASKSHRLQPLIKVVAESLNSAATEAGPAMFKNGFDLMSWLTKKDPDAEYLAYSAVAYPLSGLVQMLAYYSCVLDSRVPLDELTSVIGGAVGHSSGVCAAVVASCSSTVRDLEENIHGMVMYLFHHGVQCQKAFDISTADVSTLAALGDTKAVAPFDKFSKQKTTPPPEKPTPMLVVTDLDAEKLNQELGKVNKNLGDAKVCIGLINGPGRCVVVGPASSIEKTKKHLDANSRSLSNVVSDYLNATMSFHSPHLEPAVSEIMQIVSQAAYDSPLKRVANIRSGDMKFPVYSTVDGSDLRSSWNLQEAMCKMQSVQQLDWVKTTASLPDPSKPTFALDFGPGGARGVVAISTRVFNEENIHFFCASKYTPNIPREGSAVAPPSVLTLAKDEDFLYGMPAMLQMISDCPFHWADQEPKDISRGLSALDKTKPKLLDGAFRSIPEAKKKVGLGDGKSVKVITDVENIFSWCRAREIDNEFDSKRKTIAGQVVQVVDTDDSDNTIKVKKGGTTVWIPIQAAMAA